MITNTHHDLIIAFIDSMVFGIKVALKKLFKIEILFAFFLIVFAAFVVIFV